MSKRLNIAIVGPFSPYPGGIANHSTRLAEALESEHDVHREAFSNPFPKLLYPGKHPGSLRNSQHLLPHARYDLTYIFPGSWPKVLGRLVRENPDVVIIPWWTFFYALHYRWLTGRLRKRGIRIIFMCHNLFDHESASWKKAFCRFGLKHAESLVFHSGEEASLAKGFLSAIPSLVRPHPVYDHLPPSSASPPKGRIHLLFFGFVRPYKGLDDLILAIERIGNPKLHLTIAGDWWKGQDALHARCRRLAEEGIVTLLDRYVEDGEAAELFSSSHAVVLPYRRATNSGVLAHAIQAEKPVIASNSGGIPLAVKDGKTGYLFSPGNVEELVEAIEKLCADIDSDRDFVPDIRSIAGGMSWETFARDLAGFIADNDR